MVTDEQVKKLRHLRSLKHTVSVAAVKSGMCEKSAQKYLRSQQLPSERKQPRTWKTRADPFEAVWPILVERLRQEPKLEAKTLFEELVEEDPDGYTEGQLRTLQRRVKTWRIEEGLSKEVFFDQVHHPGALAQSDFTCMNALNITLLGRPFEHLLYHFTLTYSNWEWATIAFTENFESLAEGLSSALKALGGVPRVHQTDNLGAVKVIGEKAFRRRYEELLDHYGLDKRTSNPYSGNENGDVEQSHHRLKRAIDQALLRRGHRDFSSQSAYACFVQEVMTKKNHSRVAKFKEEVSVLAPLPGGTYLSCGHKRVRVKKNSTFCVGQNTYSISSRLIGQEIDVYIYAHHLEVWYAQKQWDRFQRLSGKGKSLIQYRHVIDWLVRKPGAFENYRYQAQFFPSTHFRMAYDGLKQKASGTRHYLEILHLAAYHSEERVNDVLRTLIEQEQCVSVEAVKSLIPHEIPRPTALQIAPVSLKGYDVFLSEALCNATH